MSESKPGAGILSCRWRQRGGGVKPHFLFMRFHGLLLVVRELTVHSLVRVCVCLSESYERATWGQHTHIVPRQHNTAANREKKHARVCSATHAHALWASTMCMQRGLSRLEGVSNTVCNPPPTMYDPFVFCDSGGREKCLFNNSAVWLWLQHPHSQSTCC